MIKYCVFNFETGKELFSSDDVLKCRKFAIAYSEENCVPCVLRCCLGEEKYINGQKLDVQ